MIISGKLQHLHTSEELKQIVTDILYINVLEIMNEKPKKITNNIWLMEEEEYHCEWCNKEMTEEDHHFCDICGDCREENEEDWNYE